MLYADTSVVVAALTIEAETQRVQHWLAEQRLAVAISWWVETEFAAALSVKLRNRLLTIAERDASMKVLDEELGASFVRLPVDREHFREAVRYAGRYRLGLRGGDALHLAIAGQNEATLCTLDKRQAEAGKALGLWTLLI